VQAGQLKKTV